MATMIELGYDIFSQIPSLRHDGQKLYIFGHYEHYDANIHTPTKRWTMKNVWSFGLNYHPLPQVAVKADYSLRALSGLYNDEPSLNIGVVYEGFFL